MTELPIACTLDARDASDRQALIARLWADALIDSAPTARGMRARLRDSPDVERRVQELIDAEARCCPFLAFELGRDGDVLVLDINGHADARPVIEFYFARAAA